MDPNARFETLETLRSDPRFERTRALDRQLECDVMLERPGPAVLAELASNDGEKALRNAKMLARITHPNIVRLRELVERDGVPTLVLDVPLGECLTDVLAREGALPPEILVPLGICLAEGAQAVHAAGVVHRGIAPVNVFVDTATGKAQLAGFTFAKPLGNRVGLSSIDHAKRRTGDAPAQGLPDYSAPEQLEGRPADHRADVYGLGCLLYRAATGREAFPDDASDLHQPEPAHKLNPAVAKPLSAVIQKCLLRTPTARFQNMVELADALKAIGTAPDRAGSPARGLLAGAAIVLVTVLTLQWSGMLGGVSGTPTDLTRGQGVQRDAPARSEFAPKYETSHAVLIGTRYDGNPHFAQLDNPERDVLAIEQRLLDLGWQSEHITTLLGPAATRDNIMGALIRIAADAGHDDQVLIYFAGHGTPHPVARGDLRLLPNDAGAPGTVGEAKWIRSGDIVDTYLAEPGFKPKHVLLVLDCCHAALAATTRSASDAIPDDSDAPMAYPEREALKRHARWVLASAGKDELAADGRGENSPFARGFLRALEAARHESVSLQGVYASIRTAIIDEGSRQAPWLSGYDDMGAEFLFLNRK